MTEPSPQQRLTPTKHTLGVGGVALFGTGGCLVWTIVLIPLAIPLVIVGAVMAIWSLFIKTEPLRCPACSETSQVEPSVAVVKCPHCGIAIRRAPDKSGWMRVT